MGYSTINMIQKIIEHWIINALMGMKQILNTTHDWAYIYGEIGYLWMVDGIVLPTLILDHQQKAWFSLGYTPTWDHLGVFLEGEAGMIDTSCTPAMATHMDFFYSIHTEPQANGGLMGFNGV